MSSTPRPPPATAQKPSHPGSARRPRRAVSGSPRSRVSQSGKPYTPHEAIPHVEYVAQPASAIRAIKESIDGDVDSDAAYARSLERMLRHQRNRLTLESEANRVVVRTRAQQQQQEPLAEQPAAGSGDDSMVVTAASRDHLSPASSVRSGGGKPRANRAGKKHWTMVALNDLDAITRKNRTFSWAHDCARGLYHNTLRPYSRDELPPVVQTIHQQQKKEKMKPYANPTAVAVTTRLCSYRYMQNPRYHRSVPTSPPAETEGSATVSSQQDPDIEPSHSPPPAQQSGNGNATEGAMHWKPIRNYRTFAALPADLKKSTSPRGKGQRQNTTNPPPTTASSPSEVEEKPQQGQGDEKGGKEEDSTVQKNDETSRDVKDDDDGDAQEL